MLKSISISRVALFLLCTGGMFFSRPTFSQNYKSLWKQYDAAIQVGLPQTAYGVTQQILQKALQEGNIGQNLSARMAGAMMRQEWAPDSFFVDIQTLEQLRAVEKDTAIRSVYASLLAMSYQNHRYRFQLREESDSAAWKNALLSLQNPQLLARTQSNTLLPFVVQETFSKYFHNDLLHILWQRFRDVAYQFTDNRKEIGATYAHVKSVYESKQNAEALLLLALDSLSLFPAPYTYQKTWTPNTDIMVCQQLIEKFGTSEICAEVYLRMLYSDAPDSLKVLWATTAIQRYKSYERIAEVKNILSELQSPYVNVRVKAVPYPFAETPLYFSYRNASAVKMEVFQLPDTFTEKCLSTEKAEKILRKTCKRVDVQNYVFSTPFAYRTYYDTLQWRAPGLGRYAFLFTATTKARDIKKKNVKSTIEVCSVSRFKPLWQQINNTFYLNIVDAVSGKPVPGVSVSLYELHNNNKRELYRVGITNHEGRVAFELDTVKKDNQHYEFSFAKDDDHYFSSSQIYHRASSNSPTPETQLKLYTDRFIYRPGQLVHVAGIAFNALGKDAKALKDSVFTLKLCDPQGEVIATQQATTDSLGTLSTDFTLPLKGLPGVYHIKTPLSSSFKNIRVEAYKRPTFSVHWEQSEDVSLVPDSTVTFKGSAQGFNGVPMRNAEVFATTTLRNSTFSKSLSDTLYTDENGFFTIFTSLKNIDTLQLQQGVHIQTAVAVHAPSGEIQQTSTSTFWSSTPLFVVLNCPRSQEKENLKPITVELLSSIGQPRPGSLCWQIFPEKSSIPVLVDTTSNAISLAPAALQSLPSGNYTLKVFATAEKDTASATAHFSLMSMQDTRLPFTRQLWLHAPKDTWEPHQPLLLQVGTSLKDADIFLTYIGGSGAISSRLLHLSDSVVTLEIPYNSVYGDILSVRAVVVKDGLLWQQPCSFYAPLPSQKLDVQWCSYRSPLQPGDTDTWEFHISQPDGTPARAQLMATLYDQSLDALTSNYGKRWSEPYHYVPSSPYSLWRSSHDGKMASSMFYEVPYIDVKPLAFDHFNEMFLNGMNVGSSMPRKNKKVSTTRARGTSTIYETVGVALNDVPLQNRVAELSTEAADEVSADESTVTYRENFNETAYFEPCLSTDEQGKVSLKFTLPESLTTWQFRGLAHDAQMRSALLDTTLVVQKKLMAQCYLPRFLRQGDAAALNASINNLTSEPLSGTALFEVLNAETEKVIFKQKKTFKVAERSHKAITFEYTAPKNTPLLLVRFSAHTKDFSDGEAQYLPVLPVQDRLTLQAQHEGEMAAVPQPASSLEMQLKSLPVLQQPKHENAYSYAEMLSGVLAAQNLVQKNDSVRTILQQWQERKQQGETLLGRLEQNQSLWQILLCETPWLTQAHTETERQNQILKYLDTYNLQQEIKEYTAKLEALQQQDGGFAWFKGMTSSPYITLHVLKFLTPVADHDGLRPLCVKAAQYLADNLHREVQHMKDATSTPQPSSWHRYLQTINILQQYSEAASKNLSSDIKYLVKGLPKALKNTNVEEKKLAISILKKLGNDKLAEMYEISLREYQPLSHDSEEGTLSVRRTLTNRGDSLVIKIILTASQDMEFVHLSSPHPAQAEYMNYTSGMQWQSGLWHYKALHDASTDYFFEHLPKGTYAIEESFFRNYQGTYHSGTASIQCLYRPEIFAVE